MAMTPGEVKAINGQLIGIGVTGFASLALQCGADQDDVDRIWEYAKNINEPLPETPGEAIRQMRRLIRLWKG